MSAKDINRKLNIQNLTNGEVKQLPYFNDDDFSPYVLKREVLYFEIMEMLKYSDSIKVFYTYN